MAEQLLHAVSTVIGIPSSWRSIGVVRTILIYKLDHLGDILLATPGLRAIRHRFPDATIRIVVGEWSSAVLANNPNVDEILIYNSPLFARYPHVAHSFKDLKASMGDWKPDLVIGLRDDWHTIGDHFFSKAYRINRGRVHLNEWVHKKMGEYPMHREGERIWQMLRPLGIAPEPAEKLDYFVDEAERKIISDVMLARGITDHFAILHAGTSVPLKEWPLKRFAEAAHHIVARYGMQIVLIGSHAEMERSAELAAMIRELDPIDISGELNLRHTAALMERAAFYLGSDGGAMHVASALGVPTLGLFGPGAYHIFHPIGPHAVAISHHFPCSPCMMITCTRPHDTCMQAISTAEVVRETDRLMSRTSATQSATVDGRLSPRTRG